LGREFLLGKNRQSHRGNIKEDRYRAVKRRLNLIIGLLISAVFIYLAFRRVSFGEILYSMKHANYWLILPNMIIVIFLMYIRAERWRYLLVPIGSFKSRHLFPSVMIGFMANNILPARLGEVVRAYSLGAKVEKSRSAIFASIVLERLFDSLSLLAMFWLVILFIPFPPFVKQFGSITLLANLCIILFLLLLKYKTSFIIKMVLRTLFFLPAALSDKIDSIMRRFAEGLNAFRRIRTLVWVIFWSIFLWLATALSNYFVFMAFGIYPNIAASFILLLFVAAGVMLPSAPGFVGVFQAATIGAFALLNQLGLLGNQMTWIKARSVALAAPLSPQMAIGSIGPLCDSLGLFGISKGESLSFSIILWLCQYLPVTLLGLYYLKREHFSLKAVEA
jgi:glycosyltransferase 2 family protein